MNKIVIFFVILLLSLSSIIIFYQEDISAKLSENLNRNLEKDWGKDHPKFIKYNLKFKCVSFRAIWFTFKFISNISNSII